MNTEISIKGRKYSCDLSKPLDISMQLSTNAENSSAWYVNPVKINPVRGDGFVGSVAEGGSVNFRDITFNPHGNGTHTESVGHISTEIVSINKTLTRYHFLALVISIEPEICNTKEGTREIGDKIISLEQIQEAIGHHKPEAIVIRTTPNSEEKLTRQYSNSNPAYLCHKAASFITEQGIDHLLIDLPSVDKEVDAGQLLSHKAFWKYPENTQIHKTITEFIFVPDEVEDGEYLLNIQIAPFENDASPSKPTLYRLFSE
ncbi:MAG: cyclase family protein [Flavobacteriales bacterium]